MNPFDKLDAAMDKFDELQSRARSEKEKKQTEQDAFIAEFSNFRAITAHPVLEEIANRLKQRGHDARVEMNEAADSGKPFGITLNVYPGGGEAEYKYTSTRDHPKFALQGDPISRKVKFYETITYPSGGMQGGPAGECWLAELSTDVLRAKAIDCIAKSLGSK
ncbi:MULTISPECIES: hypothetical protein [Burkholderia]|uniref:hypothetical protein n=1 Tax=Burkholderia TaxID=32008 RepID=UPI000755763A|nr:MULTISPECIES: hypothetical protein [Burkholderia]